MTVGIVTPATRRKADQLLEHADRWARGVRHRDGLAFVTFTSSKPGTVYFTSESGCSCPGYLHRGQCCHVVAVREDAARHRPAPSPAKEAWLPTPLKRYEDLFPPCRSCGDLCENRGTRLCDRCGSDEVYRLELAAKRQRLANE